MANKWKMGKSLSAFRVAECFRLCIEEVEMQEVGITVTRAHALCVEYSNPTLSVPFLFAFHLYRER